MESEPLFNSEDAEYLRRAAKAVRNLIHQIPDRHGEWARWVPEHLDRLAQRMTPDG